MFAIMHCEDIGTKIYKLVCKTRARSWSASFILPIRLFFYSYQLMVYKRYKYLAFYLRTISKMIFLIRYPILKWWCYKEEQFQGIKLKDTVSKYATFLYLVNDLKTIHNKNVLLRQPLRRTLSLTNNSYKQRKYIWKLQNVSV